MPERRPRRYSTTGISGREPARWGPRKVRGSRPLLFERLTGITAEGDAVGEGALYGRKELIASIGRELDALFNTRAPVAADILAGRRRTAIDFGIPDLSLYSAGDIEARATLGRHLLAAVVAYEPRLEAPAIRVVPDPAGGYRLIVHVEGDIRLDTQIEHVSFRIALHKDANDGG